MQVFWGRAPQKEESALKLLFAWNYNVGSRFKKFLAILFHGRQSMIHFNAPMSLREIVDEGQDEARTLRKINRVSCEYTSASCTPLSMVRISPTAVL